MVFESSRRFFTMRMTLTENQMDDLERVVDFVLEFEERDYLDWQKREGRQDGHVYYHAKRLWDEVLDDEQQSPAPPYEGFQEKLEEMRKYPHQDNHMD